MIKLGVLSWSNAFSYGPDNSIDLSANSLVQLVGKNGHGKSSVALILEEILFNKNSKGIKKADVLNRYSNSKSYTITLEFTKDTDQYKIITNRGTTQTVKLLCNGEDISSHTSTGTYKLIEDILGFDHKTFTQIVYQSSTYSLEFLVATDTNRKKFLIDLLDLLIYTKASDLFKSIGKEVGLDSEKLSVRVKTLTDWIARASKEDLTKRELVEVPEAISSTVLQELTALEQQLLNIDSINKKIVQNNKYKEILRSIVIVPLVKPTEDITQLKIRESELRKEITAARAVISGTGIIKDTCSMCGQKIDVSHKLTMVEEAKAVIAQKDPQLAEVLSLVRTAETATQAYTKANNAQTEWEKYHSLIDNSIQEQVLDRSQLELEIKTAKAWIAKHTKLIADANTINTQIVAHNTKVDVLINQMDSMISDLKIEQAKLEEISKRLTTLTILQKTFSSTGLIAYKIECLVKDLEEMTNNYLLDMSDGRFQISFKVNAADKLNVVVTDNGRDIDILALSNGERARVNIATLLGIRKLMETLSGTRINLLILDETVESLDVEGKEKLIEVLIKEEYLNTILVSHSFSHPLLEKIYIEKENNISRIIIT